MYNHSIIQSNIAEQYPIIQSKSNPNSLCIRTPFSHNDGDQISLFLDYINKKWELSDHGDTVFHNSLKLDNCVLNHQDIQIEDDVLFIVLRDNNIGESIFILINQILDIIYRQTK